VSDFVSCQLPSRSFVHKTMSHLNIVTSLENYDIKLFTQKVCFIPDFILTLDDVAKFEPCDKITTGNGLRSSHFVCSVKK
jgi:hypothetical protein